MTMEKPKTVKSENVIQPAAPRDRALLNQPYKPKAKGVPLPEGYTMQDLSVGQREGLMEDQLNRWKTDYNKTQRKSLQSSLTITRGLD